MVNALAKYLGPLRRAVSLMIGRGIVKLVNDAGGFQELQIALLADEVSDKIPRVQNYGFTSNPQPGAQAVIACLGGNRNKAIAIAVDDPRYRPTGLQPGEAEMYTDEGDYIKFARGRIIQVVAGTKVSVTAPEVDLIASTKVSLQTPLVECTQNLKVDGNVTVLGTAAVTGMATVGGLASTGTAGASSIAGNLNITGGNVTADGIGLKTHVHGGVMTGAGVTGVAQ